MPAWKLLLLIYVIVATIGCARLWLHAKRTVESIPPLGGRFTQRPLRAEATRRGAGNVARRSKALRSRQAVRRWCEDIRALRKTTRRRDLRKRW